MARVVAAISRWVPKIEVQWRERQTTGCAGRAKTLQKRIYHSAPAVESVHDERIRIVVRACGCGQKCRRVEGKHPTVVCGREQRGRQISVVHVLRAESQTSEPRGAGWQ